ncbi:MAG: zf-HC2 domain-containing protein [Deltaproteobacteria bacterium]|nr:zf-HC2 domain-containing protein [Deltaproteobacteria bacterium]
MSAMGEQCKELEAALIAVADGSATGEEAAQVREHIALCPACAQELAETRALLGGVRAAEADSETGGKPQAFWDALEKSVLLRVEAEAGTQAGAGAGAEATKRGRDRERARARAQESDELAAARARKVDEGRPMGRVAIYVSLVAAAAIAVFYGLRLRGGSSDAPELATRSDAGAPHEMIDPGELALEEAAGPDELDLLDDEALGRLDDELEQAEEEAFGRLDVDVGDDGDEDGEPMRMIDELSDDDLQRVYEALEPAPQGDADASDPGKSG